MTTDLSEKYDLRVPRYTSYPTAPQFVEDVDADRYAGWLAALGPDEPLSLYFHIPFCAEMCWFCGCYTKVVKRYGPVADYVETVLDEIGLVASKLPGRLPARHLHWGGGSPTMLEGADWRRMVERLRARFQIGADAEIAVEMDPRTATRAYVETLAAAGVNRASIGVQDFHPDVQAAVNRIQPYEITERAIGWLRECGIQGLNMDLMYGLPGQTVARVRDMVDQAAALAPERVALFGYAHVPWMKSHQKMIDEAALPDAPERLRQFEAAAERLLEQGYIAIGLDHFARPDDELAEALVQGRLRRNFQGYTTDISKALLGFGASSIGHLNEGYVQNISSFRGYKKAIGEGRLATARGRALSTDDRLRAEVIEKIMCGLFVDLDEVCANHSLPAGDLDADLGKLAPLVHDGLVRVEGRRIRVTGPGRPFVRLAAAAFDAYLGTGQGRHAKAV